MIEVGEAFKRQVTQQDAELFLDVKRVLEESAYNKIGLWHYGLEDIGNVVTYLVENYNIEKK